MVCQKVCQRLSFYRLLGNIECRIVGVGLIPILKDLLHQPLAEPLLGRPLLLKEKQEPQQAQRGS